MLKMEAELTKASQQFYNTVSGAKGIYMKVKKKIEAAEKHDLGQLIDD